MLRDSDLSMLSLAMAANQTVTGRISLGWTRMRGASMATLLLKTLGLLAVTVLALRLLEFG